MLRKDLELEHLSIGQYEGRDPIPKTLRVMDQKALAIEHLIL
jgi:hypothetical protein